MIKDTYQVGCVYLFSNINKELLYVGKTYNLRNRLYQHFNDNEDWKSEIYYIEYMILENETDRDIVETYCINLYNPIYNKDKIFAIKPSIKIELPERYLITTQYFLQNIKINRRKGSGSFKEICIEYLNNPSSRYLLEQECPLLKECYEKLGSKRITSLSYCKTKLIEELNLIKEDSQEKLKNTLYTTFELNKTYSLKEAKNLLAEAYLKLNINKAAKCTTLKHYYKIQNKSFRLEGKTVKALQLINVI